MVRGEKGTPFFDGVPFSLFVKSPPDNPASFIFHYLPTAATCAPSACRLTITSVMSSAAGVPCVHLVRAASMRSRMPAAEVSML